MPAYHQQLQPGRAGPAGHDRTTGQGPDATPAGAGSRRAPDSVVLDESVLQRRIGDESVMYEQLQRLAKEADRPNLTLQVLPLAAQHTVFGESFVIFGFGTDSDAMLQEVVSTEQLKSGFTLEGERETYLHRIAFQLLADAALDPVTSKALILETAESHWSGAAGAPMLNTASRLSPSHGAGSRRGRSRVSCQES